MKFMKTIENTLTPEFGPEVRFELRPTGQNQCFDRIEKEFRELRERLTSDALEQVYALGLHEKIEHAANDAAALAWTTSYPLLFWPMLFAEKANAARLQVQKQGLILDRSSALVERANAE